MQQGSLIIDTVTGLYNVQFLKEVLSRETARADRYCIPLTILLLDVDHVKQVNEYHGHGASGRVLKSIATILRSTVRNVDFVFRYVGDTFAILLPHTDLKASTHVRQRITDRLESSELVVENITVTIAGCEYHRSSHFESLISSAEKALLRAKGGDDDDDPSGVPAYI